MALIKPCFFAGVIIFLFPVIGDAGCNGPNSAHLNLSLVVDDYVPLCGPVSVSGVPENMSGDYTWNEKVDECSTGAGQLSSEATVGSQYLKCTFAPDASGWSGECVAEKTVTVFNMTQEPAGFSVSSVDVDNQTYTLSKLEWKYLPVTISDVSFECGDNNSGSLTSGSGESDVTGLTVPYNVLVQRESDKTGFYFREFDSIVC